MRDTAEFHTLAFSHFMSRQKWGGHKAFWRAQHPETIYDILSMGGKGYLFGFLFEIPVIRKALWRRIFAAGRMWHGPDNELINLTFGEFRYAEDCLNAYLADKNDDALNTFIACLWRPGITRKPFSFQKTDAIARKAAGIRRELKQALLLQYIAMRGFVIQSNKGAFDEPEGSTGGGTATWGTLISALATNITDIERIEHMPLWTALEWLSNRKKLTPKRQEDE